MQSALPGTWFKPFATAEAEVMQDGRTVSDEIMDYYAAERLGVSLAELRAMRVEDVLDGLAYAHGKDVGRYYAMRQER